MLSLCQSPPATLPPFSPASVTLGGYLPTVSAAAEAADAVKLSMAYIITTAKRIMTTPFEKIRL